MFDLTEKNDIAKYMQIFHSKMDRLTALFFKSILPIYKKHFTLAANYVGQGILRDAPFLAVREASGKLEDKFVLNYRRTAKIFAEWTLKEFERQKAVHFSKSPLDDFWAEFDTYVAAETARKVATVEASQLVLLRDIIEKGMRENLSHKDIAKEITNKKLLISTYKARRIARTETHSVANYATHKQIEKTGKTGVRKKWSHSADERVRTKKFNHKINEVVKMEEDFIETGEPLEFPGDPSGSAGNIIHCRCVEIFLTR